MDRTDIEKIIPRKTGQALQAVSRGRDMTKLDIKNVTGLSMTTVLSAVEEMKERGLITYSERPAERGGKPHSVINVSEKVAVYGVSYRSRRLTAVSVNLRGEKTEERTLEVTELSTPLDRVERILSALRKTSPPPVAVTLAMNGVGMEEVARIVEERYNAPCILSGIAAATAFRAWWEEGVAPLSVIGVGKGVKCAFLSDTLRVADVGKLPCPAARTKAGWRYADVLSVDEVRGRLEKKDLRGVYAATGTQFFECVEMSEYSALLAKTISSLVDTTALLLAPKKTYLFGEYVTAGFFDTIECGTPLSRLSAEPADFAYGAALQALLQGVFNR